MYVPCVVCLVWFECVRACACGGCDAVVVSLFVVVRGKLNLGNLYDYYTLAHIII